MGLKQRTESAGWSRGTIAFAGVRVFDGARMREGQTVQGDGERIAHAGPAGAGLPARASRVVDGKGRTLLPSFIDAPVHLGLHEPRTELHGRVATARGLGSPARQQ